MMRNRVGMILLVLVSAACGGGSAAPMPDGPVKVGVIAGNHQVVTAAPRVPLPQSVVVQSVVLPSGQVATRVHTLSPMELLTRAVLPELAYAQTAVKGKPGLVSCNFIPDPKHPLTAKSVCATGDSLGNAYFDYLGDTVAGRSRAQIVTTINQTTQVTDSVSATVNPAAPMAIGLAWGYSQFYTVLPGGIVAIPIGGTVDLHKMIRLVQDKYHNFIAPQDGQFSSTSYLADTVSNYTPSYAMRATTSNIQPATPDATGWIVTPSFAKSGDAVTVFLFAGTTIAATFTVQAK